MYDRSWVERIEEAIRVGRDNARKGWRILHDDFFEERWPKFPCASPESSLHLTCPAVLLSPGIYLTILRVTVFLWFSCHCTNVGLHLQSHFLDTKKSPSLSPWASLLSAHYAIQTALSFFLLSWSYPIFLSSRNGKERDQSGEIFFTSKGYNGKCKTL